MPSTRPSQVFDLREFEALTCSRREDGLVKGSTNISMGKRHVCSIQDNCPRCSIHVVWIKRNL